MTASSPNPAVNRGKTTLDSTPGSFAPKTNSAPGAGAALHSAGQSDASKAAAADAAGEYSTQISEACETFEDNFASRFPGCRFTASYNRDQAGPEGSRLAFTDSNGISHHVLIRDDCFTGVTVIPDGAQAAGLDTVGGHVTLGHPFGGHHIAPRASDIELAAAESILRGGKQTAFRNILETTPVRPEFIKYIDDEDQPGAARYFDVTTGNTLDISPLHPSRDTTDATTGDADSIRLRFSQELADPSDEESHVDIASVVNVTVRRLNPSGQIEVIDSDGHRVHPASAELYLAEAQRRGAPDLAETMRQAHTTGVRTLAESMTGIKVGQAATVNDDGGYTRYTNSRGVADHARREAINGDFAEAPELYYSVGDYGPDPTL